MPPRLSNQQKQFNHDWGGRPWDKETKELLEKYNPINYVHKWSTPQLVIHGSKDYRLPETDGIGAFHALKQCAHIRISLLDQTLKIIATGWEYQLDWSSSPMRTIGF